MFAESGPWKSVYHVPLISNWMHRSRNFSCIQKLHCLSRLLHYPKWNAAQCIEEHFSGYQCKYKFPQANEQKLELNKHSNNALKVLSPANEKRLIDLGNRKQRILVIPLKLTRTKKYRRMDSTALASERLESKWMLKRCLEGMCKIRTAQSSESHRVVVGDVFPPRLFLCHRAHVEPRCGVG